MASKSGLSYRVRSETHHLSVARKLFGIAESKKSNLVLSADFIDTKSLLACADALGPFIAVLKTHIDIVEDFGDETVNGLKRLALQHNFLIFEDRKFVDIGTTVQKQYHRGALRISEWAHIVNVSILGGDGVVDAMEQLIAQDSFPFREERAILLLAEMTTAGSMATGSYTEKCVEIAEKRHGILGFVATQSLRRAKSASESSNQDFVIFTTGVNRTKTSGELGQQYQTPSSAINGGSDFIIVGRGIYESVDPIAEARRYQAEAWQAYEERTATR